MTNKKLEGIYLGDSNIFYSVFLKYEGEEKTSDTLFPKHIFALEWYLLGLRDGAGSMPISNEIPVYNGHPTISNIKPLDKEDFTKLEEAITRWDNFQLCSGDADFE